MDDLADFECYDALLYAPLRRLGWAVSPVPWRKADVDWNRFEVVVEIEGQARPALVADWLGRAYLGE